MIARRKSQSIKKPKGSGYARTPLQKKKRPDGEYMNPTETSYAKSSMAAPNIQYPDEDNRI